MATKKDIQKNDRKGTGAGLAAGMESENKAPKTEKQKYEEYLSRLWSHKANEAVTVEIVAGGAYALASELIAPTNAMTEPTDKSTNPNNTTSSIPAAKTRI